MLCFGIWEGLPSGLFPGLRDLISTKCPEVMGPDAYNYPKLPLGLSAGLPHPTVPGAPRPSLESSPWEWLLGGNSK